MNMFLLNSEYLLAHYNEFMCSYGNVDVSSIISRDSFSPETFFVNQKLNGEKTIFFRDVNFREWTFRMITDIINRIDITYSKDMLSQIVFQNVLYLLRYKNNASKIANQEFIDIIRRVVAYTLTGEVNSEVHTAKEFNTLASKLLPSVVKHFRELNLPSREILVYSITSGLSGLDLKGAPAAASTHTNEGIKMGDYKLKDGTIVVEDFISSLTALYKRTHSTLFDWDAFVEMLQVKSKLVWMTDDYIETHFDLLVISSLLQEFNIKIEIVPKNGYNGNDMSYKDMMEILSTDLFDDLKSHLHSGRLTISPFGPKMGAANIHKLSPECVKSIKDAGLLFAKGCRIHEMLQGGLSIDFFTSFYIVRNLSEITSGITAEQNEAVFLHLEPNEYAFWGVAYANSRKAIIGEKRLVLCASTSVEHFKRKSMSNIRELTEEFTNLQHIETSYIGDKYPIHQEMNMLAQKIQLYTVAQYSKKSGLYAGLLRTDMTRIESELWKLLFSEVKLRLGKDPNEISLLDVGTGDGCAIEYASSLGVNILGIDNSPGFINLLNDKASRNKIPQNSFLFSNMCSISAGNNVFDVVRMNASLLHLPLIGEGFTVDLALSEANRVLKDGGLLYVLVKHGTGVALVDTHEGLGMRFYQFYTHELLKLVLDRNGFITLTTMEQYEKRGDEIIRWNINISQKKNNTGASSYI